MRLFSVEWDKFHVVESQVIERFVLGLDVTCGNTESMCFRILEFHLAPKRFFDRTVEWHGGLCLVEIGKGLLIVVHIKLYECTGGEEFLQRGVLDILESYLVSAGDDGLL